MFYVMPENFNPQDPLVLIQLLKFYCGGASIALKK